MEETKVLEKSTIEAELSAAIKENESIGEISNILPVGTPSSILDSSFSSVHSEKKINSNNLMESFLQMIRDNDLDSVKKVVENTTQKKDDESIFDINYRGILLNKLNPLYFLI
jgi:hypothetical protein